jgi:hypothetical protein
MINLFLFIFFVFLGFFGWIGVQLAYIIVCLLCAGALSFKTRNLPSGKIYKSTISICFVSLSVHVLV